MMKRLFLAAALLTVTGCGYNRIQTLDEQASAYKSQIQVQLQRRADLVPNLVATVKGYAQQEQTIFLGVANARARLLGSLQGGSLAQMADANQGLTGALSRLIAISENYPQLKSDRNFRALQDQLEGTENRIATAREDYNAAVQEYNTYIRRFPQVLTARVLGKQPREYFQLTSASAAQVPTVDFSTPTTPAKAQ